MADRKLGRGLEGLINTASKQPIPEIEAEPVSTAAASTAAPSTLPVSALDPNPFQPRQGMEPADLESLKASIVEHGVLQPIVVRRKEDRFQIIAGERRFRAAQGAGLAEVPVVIREATDDEMLELALVENLQREDLDPIEKATSFKAYLDKTHRTQESASIRLGVDRSTLANVIRLLELPQEIQAMLRTGLLAMGHARAILSVETPKRQIEIAERVAREGLSVRQVERLAGPSPTAKRKTKRGAKGANVRDLEAKLREALGTKVLVEEGPKQGTGKIVIEFYSHEDLERIMARLA
jgi:ParB family chromosome partitioning protein